MEVVEKSCLVRMSFKVFLTLIHECLARTVAC